MKKTLLTIGSAIFTFTALTVFAQDAVIPPTNEELQAFLVLISGVGGMKGLALGLVVIQGLMLFFRSNLADFAGKWKLAIVAGLSFAFALVTGLAQGLPLMSVLLSGATLTAFQVFANQIWKQVAVKKE